MLQKARLKLSQMPDKKLCFVIGPIGDPESEPRVHADWLLEGIIEPVLVGFPDFKVKRADQDPRPGLIDAQLINDLLNAELVIADLSFLNPNVYYEIGIRHMAQKPIIHMQLAIEKPPFDLSLYRAIKFSRSKFRDLGAAQAELKRAIDAVLSKGYEIENPVTSARGRFKLSEHATSEEKVVIDQLDSFGERIEALEDQLRFLSPVQTNDPFTTVTNSQFTSPDFRKSPKLIRLQITLASTEDETFDKIREWVDQKIPHIRRTTQMDDVILVELLRTPSSVTRVRQLLMDSERPKEIKEMFVS